MEKPNKALDSWDLAAMTCYKAAYQEYTKGNYQEAINKFDKSIELDGNNYVTYRSRGTLKYELKDYTGAIKDFTKAMELEPNDYVSLYRKRFAECDLEELNKMGVK